MNRVLKGRIPLLRNVLGTNSTPDLSFCLSCALWKQLRSLLCAYFQALNLEKSVGSWFLVQPLDSTALQKNARLTEWVRLRFYSKHCETNSLHYNSMPN